MIVYVNQNNEIKDVNTTLDTTLIPLEITSEENPFKDWPVAKICCYMATVQDGMVTMMTPYVDTRIIEHIERLAKSLEIANNDSGICLEAIAELYTMIEGGQKNG